MSRRSRSAEMDALADRMLDAVMNGGELAPALTPPPSAQPALDLSCFELATTGRRILISGPAVAGKSTFAHQHASEGALIVDYDVIAQQLGSPDPWDHPHHIRAEAGKEWARLVRQAAELDEAWVIRTAPDPVERLRLAARIGARQIIVLSPPLDELRERAVRDGRPDWTVPAIERWWARFRPTPFDSNVLEC